MGFLRSDTMPVIDVTAVHSVTNHRSDSSQLNSDSSRLNS